MSDFFNTIKGYLIEYLPKQRCFRENTIRSYRQVLNLFVSYLRDQCEMQVKHICFESINREVVLNFLEWLETERQCGANTRNQRLMVLRSFFNYAGQLDCAYTALGISIQNIPLKSIEMKTVEYLSEPALESLLKQPDISKKLGVRNLFFMVLMYDTAARCSEIINLKICDLRINVLNPIAYLHGKGNKTRTVPLLKRTVQHYERYMKIFHNGEASASEKPLFYTTNHGIQQHMSPDTAALFLKNYGQSASVTCAEMPKHIHPHMLRHTRAMHLYQQGMPMMLLSEYLGHASIEATKKYAYADTEMKRKALDKVNVAKTDADSATPIWFDDEDMILKLSGLT